jgi:hypothetical protein
MVCIFKFKNYHQLFISIYMHMLFNIAVNVCLYYLAAPFLIIQPGQNAQLAYQCLQCYITLPVHVEWTLITRSRF